MPTSRGIGENLIAAALWAGVFWLINYFGGLGTEWSALLGIVAMGLTGTFLVRRDHLPRRALRWHERKDLTESQRNELAERQTKRNALVDELQRVRGGGIDGYRPERTAKRIAAEIGELDREMKELRDRWPETKQGHREERARQLVREAKVVKKDIDYSPLPPVWEGDFVDALNMSVGTHAFSEAEARENLVWHVYAQIRAREEPRVP